jgi:hypothetical protein
MSAVLDLLSEVNKLYHSTTEAPYDEIETW